MGAEIKSPVTSKVAPHRRYVPLDRRRPSDAPGAATRLGAVSGRARGLPPPGSCPSCRSMVQLGLLLAVFKVYQIEGRAFLALATLVLAALPVHYLAPYRWKKPLFVAVSLAGLFWVFGTGGGRDRPGAGRRPDRGLLPAGLVDGPRRGPGRCWPRPWPPRAARNLIAAGPVDGLAGPGDDVHVPDDHLSVRAEACAGPREPGRHAQLFLPAAELLLPAFPGRRLPDHAARLLRRRRPRHPAAGAADDASAGRSTCSATG